MTQKDELILKWGTLKGYHLHSEAALAAMKKYIETEGDISMSAMAHHDTEEQRAALLEVIDAIDGTIYLSWDGRYVDKEEAKEYILNYRK